LEDSTALDPQLQAPYLRRRQDQNCSRADEWHSDISKDDLAGALGDLVRGPIATVRVTARTESGRVTTVVVNDRNVDATDFRLAVGRALGWEKLRSDLYEVQDRGDRVSFRGRGQGHGVGLCQAGADAMGTQGHGYREILAYYYPGTSLGINAQGMRWQKFGGERIDIIATRQQDAQTVTPIAERALRLAVDKTGWKLSGRPQIMVFPSIDVYRDATGEPGWVAASTRGTTIRLQPVRTLQARGVLESTLKHEFLHMVIEAHSRPDTPLWFSEGLVIYLADPDRLRPMQVDVVELEKRLRSAHSESEMRSAYHEASGAIAMAVKRHSLATVLSWASVSVPVKPY
jgi:stage II sporulation protein D